MAVASAIVVYVALVITMGASFPRSTLQTNMNAMQESCISQYVVVTGVIISSISSALGSLFGGSRVLQALARDDLFPCLKYFAKGTFATCSIYRDNNKKNNLMKSLTKNLMKSLIKLDEILI